MTVLELGNNCLLEGIHWEIKILNGGALCYITEVFNRIGLAEGLILGGCIDYADPGVKIDTDILIEEFLRGDA